MKSKCFRIPASKRFGWMLTAGLALGANLIAVGLMSCTDQKYCSASDTYVATHESCPDDGEHGAALQQDASTSYEASSFDGSRTDASATDAASTVDATEEDASDATDDQG